jgi:hypothetical protein
VTKIKNYSKNKELAGSFVKTVTNQVLPQNGRKAGLQNTGNVSFPIICQEV